jgi:HNH endonuclease
MTVRLPGELYEWLRREAFETREPMSVIIIAAISEHRARASARGKGIHHKDGNPRNNDLDNLELRESPR